MQKDNELIACGRWEGENKYIKEKVKKEKNKEQIQSQKHSTNSVTADNTQAHE